MGSETESMVERVAKAIGMTIPNRSDATYVTPYTMLAARAAIEAMREPSKAMVLTGTETIEELRDWTRDTNGVSECTDYAAMASPTWRAMIDKALEE